MLRASTFRPSTVSEDRPTLVACPRITRDGTHARESKPLATFEDGWICQKCWSANRDSDSRCYRCHSEPTSYPMSQLGVPVQSAAVSRPATVPRVVSTPPSPPRETFDGHRPEPVANASKAMPRLTLPSLPISVMGAIRGMPGRVGRARDTITAVWNGTARRAQAARQRAGIFAFWLSAMVLCWLVIFFELAPESAGGRLLASLLATVGLGLFSAATSVATSAALAERHRSPAAGEPREG